ncbi:MAG: TlpA disulfide reductase family protein [Ginsengibacter sp.]
MRIVRALIIIFLFAAVTFTTVKAQGISSWKIKDVVHYIDNSDSVLVINFWATFCKPCIEEMPYLESISQKYTDQKVKILLVSLDLPDFFPGKIEAFVKKNNYSSQVVWLNESNADYFCPKIDKSWSGAIPSTFIINKKKGYKKFIEEKMKPEEFERELKKALGV